MTMQTPLKTSFLNVLNAAANYPILTFCPASGQRVNSWRLMAPEEGYRTRSPEEKSVQHCCNISDCVCDKSSYRPHITSVIANTDIFNHIILYGF